MDVVQPHSEQALIDLVLIFLSGQPFSAGSEVDVLDLRVLLLEVLSCSNDCTASSYASHKDIYFPSQVQLSYSGSVVP